MEGKKFEMKLLGGDGRAEACKRRQDLFILINNPVVAWDVINNRGVPNLISAVVTAVVVIRFRQPGLNVENIHVDE